MHGDCSEAHCSCHSGYDENGHFDYAGPTCSYKEYCGVHSDCPENSSCQEKPDGGKLCTCDENYGPAWATSNPSQACQHQDPCVADPCQNSGNCIHSGDFHTYTCEC